MIIGAAAGVVLAIFSVIVEDMHTVVDLILALGGETLILPEGFAFPFQVTGLVVNPILAIAGIVFGLGLIGAWRKTGERTAQWAGLAAILYGVAQGVAAVADIRYARALEALQAGMAVSVLAGPGLWRGISALLLGLTGGLILSALLLIYFRRTENTLGKTGAVIVLITVAIGIVVKTLSLWLYPAALMTVFLLVMALKSVGLVFISGALYQQASIPYNRRSSLINNTGA